jgi:hypothetical protein
MGYFPLTGNPEVVLTVANNRVVHSLSATAIFSSIDAVLCCCESSRVIFAAYSDCSDGSFMRHAALGFRAHSGWTSLVAISLEEGSPLVLFRERPHLVKTFTYEFRQPYHTAAKRPPVEAHGFISRLRVEARGLSYRVVHSVQMNLQKRGYELKRCSLLLASGKPLPGLHQILASHALIHAADGELFREALLHASKRCGVELFTAKESELIARAVQDLHLQPNELRRRLTNLGHPLGSPWSQDEKFAALVAWLSLL